MAELGMPLEGKQKEWFESSKALTYAHGEQIRRLPYGVEMNTDGVLADDVGAEVQRA
jgi:hypothetical protein